MFETLIHFGSQTLEMNGYSSFSPVILHFLTCKPSN